MILLLHRQGLDGFGDRPRSSGLIAKPFANALYYSGPGASSLWSSQAASAGFEPFVPYLRERVMAHYPGLI